MQATRENLKEISINNLREQKRDLRNENIAKIKSSLGLDDEKLNIIRIRTKRQRNEKTEKKIRSIQVPSSKKEKFQRDKLVGNILSKK